MCGFIVHFMVYEIIFCMDILSWNDDLAYVALYNYTFTHKNYGLQPLRFSLGVDHKYSPSLRAEIASSLASNWECICITKDGDTFS